MQTTTGQLLLNEALPEDLRDYHRTIDKKTLTSLYTSLEAAHSDKYRSVDHALHTLGANVATDYGRASSFSLKDFKTPASVKAHHKAIAEGVQAILGGKDSEQSQQDKIVELIASYSDRVTDDNYKDALRENNPLGVQVLSGSRGNPVQFRSLRGGDLLVVDHKSRPIPVPVLSSYSEGLDPAQYWAGSYAARAGELAKKFATPKAGYLGKQLSMAAHRIVVTEPDCGASTGIPTVAFDSDNEGSVLAQDAGDFKAGTPLTPMMLKRLGDAKIIVRSPMTCRATSGVCQRCSGVRERGGFPPIGENVGIAAAQAISEVLSQSQLSAKHSGGTISSRAQSAGKTGLDLVNQIIQVPENFAGGAAISGEDGHVTDLREAPQGGMYVVVNKQEHWVPPGFSPTVKKGDTIEAGDVLSTGLPNPGIIVQHKGVGEGRRYFMDIFSKALKDSKVSANRRNVEILSRGLVGHVRITDLDGPEDTVPDDVVEYDSLVRGYQPRFGFKKVNPKQATGLYLEEPVLHYSVGTRVTPRVAKTLEENRIPTVAAHVDKPSFVPEMSRAMETLAHSDDWMVRLGGLYGVKKSVLKGVHRGIAADTHGTSFIAPLAQGVEFGRNKTDKKGY